MEIAQEIFSHAICYYGLESIDWFADHGRTIELEQSEIAIKPVCKIRRGKGKWK